MSALLEEVAAALAARGRLRCVPTVEVDKRDGTMVLTVKVPPGIQDFGGAEARVASLYHEVQYVCDMATLRALCVRHDIPIEQLEAVLPPKEQ